MSIAAKAKFAPPPINSNQIEKKNEPKKCGFEPNVNNITDIFHVNKKYRFAYMLVLWIRRRFGSILPVLTHRTHRTYRKTYASFYPFRIPPSQLQTIQWGGPIFFLQHIFIAFQGISGMPSTYAHKNVHTHTHSCARIMALDRILDVMLCLRLCYTIAQNGFGRHRRGCQLSFRHLNTTGRPQ